MQLRFVSSFNVKNNLSVCKFLLAINILFVGVNINPLNAFAANVTKSNSTNHKAEVLGESVELSCEKLLTLYQADKCAAGGEKPELKLPTEVIKISPIEQRACQSKLNTVGVPGSQDIPFICSEFIIE